MSRCRLLCSSVLLLATSSTFLLAVDEYPITYERNVAVKMRDGVTLRADVYHPRAEGKFPTLLQRTPYNKDSEFEFGMKAAARGYVVIVQDVRGRYASEGDWYTFKNEPSDGYDTVEWAAGLPYSDGRVGMFGGCGLVSQQEIFRRSGLLSGARGWNRLGTAKAYGGGSLM